jgi:hypothetical protein
MKCPRSNQAPPAAKPPNGRRATPGRRGRRIALALLAGIAVGQAHAQELIANAGLSSATLSQNEVRLFFTMRLQQWPNGQPVKVFVLPDDHALHRDFTKTVLGLFPYQLRRVWDRQVFSGTGQAPTTVTDEREMLRRIAATPGAIGYLKSAPDDPRVETLEVR